MPGEIEIDESLVYEDPSVRTPTAPLIFRPIYGADGKPALTAAFGGGSTPIPGTKPAMCEHAIPYTNGTCWYTSRYNPSIYPLYETIITRSDANGVTLEADQNARAFISLRFVTPGKAKRLRASLRWSTDIPSGYEMVGVSINAAIDTDARIKSTTPPLVFTREYIASLDPVGSSPRNGFLMYRWVDGGFEDPGDGFYNQDVTYLGVWNRFQIDLWLYGTVIAYREEDASSLYAPVSLSVDLSFV